MKFRFLWAVLAAHLLSLEQVRADEIKIAVEKIIASGRTLSHPRIAFGAGVYLIVWQEGSAGIDSTSAIRAVRLQANTLEPLDKSPLQLSAASNTQEAPMAAYADGVFLVASQQFRDGKHYNVRLAIVNARTGAIEDGRYPAPGTRNQLRPAIAANGKTFFVVWQEMGERDTFGIRGTRIARDGQPLDSEPHEYAASGTSPSVCVSGDKMLVAWTNRDRNQATTSATLVAPDNGKKINDLSKINTCCGDTPASSGDGRGGFVTVSGRASNPDPWGWGGPGAVVLSRVLADGGTPESQLNYAYRLSNLCSRSVPNVVDAAVWKGSKTWDAGAVGGFPGTQDGLWPTGAPAVAHAGNGLYVFAWVKGTLNKDKLTVANSDVWLHGTDAQSLATRIADQKAAAAVNADETQPHLASGPPGELLLGYIVLQPGEDRRIAIRRLAVSSKTE